MSIRTWSGMVMVVMVLSAQAMGAAVNGRPALVIRAYAITAMPPGEWNGSIREATSILDDAGVDVAWVECPARTGAGVAGTFRCTQPLESNELALRLVRGHQSDRGPHRPLGESLLVPSQGGGTLATIYLDQVEWLARAGRVRPHLVLARAIAHEVGHLLLGTSAHSTRGLLRPVWTSQELARSAVGDWLFDADDAAELRRAVSRRTTRPEGSVAAWSSH